MLSPELAKVIFSPNFAVPMLLGLVVMGICCRLFYEIVRDSGR